MTKSLYVIFICKENSKNFTYKKLEKFTMFSDMKPAERLLEHCKIGKLLEIETERPKVKTVDNEIRRVSTTFDF